MSFFKSVKGKNESKIVKLPDTDAELEIFKITYYEVGEFNSRLNAINYEADSRSIDTQKIKMSGTEFSLAKLNAEIYLLSKSLRIPESNIEDSSISQEQIEFLIAQVKDFNQMTLNPDEIEKFFPERSQDGDVESAQVK